MGDDLSDKLRTAIRASGLSLSQLEQDSGVSRAILSRFMRGERTMTIRTAERIAAALDHDIDLRPRRRARSKRSR